MRKRKEMILRFAGIGTLHATLYLWLIPKVILPMYGDKGSKLVFAVAGVLSISVVGTLFLRKKTKK